MTPPAAAPRAAPVASLPMYQRAELADAHARYWALIRRGLTERGIESPVELSQQRDEFSTWLDPALVLSQTCGMPYRTRLHGSVTLIGTPNFEVEGCPPGYYRSMFIVRADDLRTKVEDFTSSTFAYNQDHSQSGFAAAYNHVTKLGFWFSDRLHAGQHLESARAVSDGRADIAALDAVTWRLIERHEHFASTLKVIGATEPTPGLPYISRAGVNARLVFDAVAQAIDDLRQPDRHALGIVGLVAIPSDQYHNVPNPPPDALI